MDKGRSESSDTAGTPRGNLPPQPTPLIGRAEELETARAQLLSPGVRLLTLIGPGGVGKTRLALAVAELLRDDPAFPDGVWFVDLAPLPGPEAVPSAIVRALGVQELDGRTALDVLESALVSHRLLLVLDNFEHLLGAAGDIAHVLGACPGVVVLTTSREPLRLRWERTLPLGPLAVPDPQHLPRVEQLAEVPAVTLFIQRARATSPAFTLTVENAGAVAALCHRLDGLPLAIELVAARAALLGPAALLDRLGRRLPLPASAMQDAPERHQTLRATIQWSYDLLDAAEQALFRRVAIFAGGWTLDAAEAVGGPPPHAQTGGVIGAAVEDVLGGLTSLADKSLVQVDTANGAAAQEPRFRMLETAREVALGLLEASGEADALRAAHAAYFADLAERAEPGLQGTDQAVWFARLEREQGNFRQALRWAIERGAVEQGLRLAGALGWFWFLHGYPTEAREWLSALLDLAGGDGPDASVVPPAVRAKALNSAGFRAIQHGDYATALELCRQALALWRRLDDAPGIQGALHGVGDASLWLEQADVARPAYEEGLERAAAAGHAEEVGLFAYHLGQLCWLQRDFAAARSYAERALAAARQRGSATWTAYSLFVLASLAHELGDAAEAGRLYREALGIARDIGDKTNIQMLLRALAGLACLERDWVRALRLGSAADALIESSGVVPFPPVRVRQEQWLAPARSAVAPAEQAAAVAEGQAIPLDRTIAYALEESTPAAAPAAPTGPVGGVTTFTNATGASSGPLSPREREVLALVAEGKSNREIATALIVTENTAKYHVAQLLNKLGANSRAEAVARAVGAGILRPSG